MRKCFICQGVLQYPFLANYELGRFICRECCEKKREAVKKEMVTWNNKSIRKELD